LSDLDEKIFNRIVKFDKVNSYLDLFPENEVLKTDLKILSYDFVLTSYIDNNSFNKVDIISSLEKIKKAKEKIAFST